jgi:hypothetical protein
MMRKGAVREAPAIFHLLYLAGTQPWPGMYSRLPDGCDAHPAAISVNTSRRIRQSFDMGKI